MKLSTRDAIVAAGVYVIFGVIWIVFSDWFFLSIVNNDLDQFVWFSTVKGLLFVFLSTGIIFFTLLFQIKRRTVIERQMLINKEKNALFQGMISEQRERLFTLIKESPVPMVLHAENKQVLTVSKSFTEQTGFTIDEIPTIKAWVEHAFRSDIHEHMQSMNQLYRIKDSLYQGTFRVFTKEGDTLTWDMHAIYIGRDEHGLRNIVSMALDLTKHAEKERKLSHLSNHDDLTGLYNRRYYNEMIEKYAHDEHLEIILADINGLKLINDVFGHQEGDRLLIQFANTLKDHMPKDAILFRLGGDEFAVLLSKATPNDLEPLIRTIKEHFITHSPQDIKPGVSFGIARKLPNELLTQTFLRAENSLYKEKIHEYDTHSNFMIKSIQHTLYEISDETPDHIKRMLALSAKLKGKLDLSQQEKKDLDTLIALHDIGKVSLSGEIFKTERALNPEERKEIEKHTEIGYRICNAMPQLKQIAYAILTHHENVDGSGYPFGLKGEDIPFIARVMRVVDSYDSMTSIRPYRKALTEDNALKELKKYAGIYYDTDILNVFVETVKSA